MKTLRHYLSAGLLAWALCRGGEPVLEIVHITDSHVMNLAGVHPKLVAAREHYRDSGVILSRLLERLGRGPSPAFILLTGDVIDAYSFDGGSSEAAREQIDAFQPIYDRSQTPVFLALGNHDLHRYRHVEGKPGPVADHSVAEEARLKWKQVFNCFREGTYYSFRRQVGGTTYRFLVLDNGQSVSSNPGFYAEQLRWVKGQVSSNQQDTIILAMHVPLGDDDFSKSVRAVLMNADGVALALAGHRHSDALEEIDLGPRRLTQVRTALLASNGDHWRRLRLFEDRIEISATGQPEQVIKAVPAQAARPAVAGQVLPPWTEGTLDIHRISTGKGDAVFYVFPDGTTVLADPGATGRQGPRVTGQRPDSSRTPGEWVVRYLRRMMPARSGGALDYGLLSHFHGDHMGDVMPDSRTSASGAYKLTGITEVGDQIPIRRLLDRGWPDYAYPAPLEDAMMRNYRAFIEWQSRNRGLKVERFQPGRSDQIVPVHGARRYPEFEIRNVAANGEVWTGVGTATRQHFPPLRDLQGQGLPSENMCSAAFRLSYGKFDYFSGGDIPGVPEEWAPVWHDLETPVAKAVGPVDVNVLNHHGYLDTENAFLVATLRPRVHIFSVWSPSHPDARALRRLMSTQLYPGPRDIFATNMMEANKVVIEALAKLKSEHGHILVRVAPGGGSYHVLILDDSAETYKVTAVHGPYPSM